MQDGNRLGFSVISVSNIILLFAALYWLLTCPMSNFNWSSLRTVFLSLLFCAVIVYWFNFAPGRQEKVVGILESQGYENIITGGYNFLGCSSDDAQRLEFKAEYNNRSVQGFVCGGMFKGYTIRLK
jgi:hypothetical protein